MNSLCKEIKFLCVSKKYLIVRTREEVPGLQAVQEPAHLQNPLTARPVPPDHREDPHPSAAVRSDRVVH